MHVGNLQFLQVERVPAVVGLHTGTYTGISTYGCTGRILPPAFMDPNIVAQLGRRLLLIRRANETIHDTETNDWHLLAVQCVMLLAFYTSGS